MSLLDDYRIQRQAEGIAYENATGLSCDDTSTDEYRDYFADRPRVTLKAWLQDHRAEQPPACITSWEATLMTARRLAELAVAGDWVASDELVRRAIADALATH